MATVGEKPASICCKLGLRPLTKHNLLYYYAPIQSLVSYTALSINVMNPSLIVRAFPKRDLTNILLFNTLFGTGFYIYGREHMKKVNNRERVLYSAVGAIMFSFGSVLIWAIGRSILPRNMVFCTVAGVGSGLFLAKVGRDYMNHVDSQIKPEN